MKTDKKIKALVIAPVVIGLILIVIGIVSQNTGVLYAGIIVLFGGSVVAAFITVAITVIKVKRDNSEIADIFIRISLNLIDGSRRIIDRLRQI